MVSGIRTGWVGSWYICTLSSAGHKPYLDFGETPAMNETGPRLLLVNVWRLFLRLVCTHYAGAGKRPLEWLM